MISLEKLRAWTPPVARQSYDEAYCSLYALAHGLGQDPENPVDLAFVARPIQHVFPTMAIALANEDRALEHGGTGIDYGQVVLGEQSVVLHRPLPVAASVVSRGEVGAVVDKGAGRSAIVTLVRRLYDEADPERPLATMSATYIARGQGGFGGPSGGSEAIVNAPVGPPGRTVEFTLPPPLALLFDLTGDYVDFHVDPEAARRIGFDRPILHGLCTVGLAARAIMIACPERAAAIQSVSVRLGAAIYPGERLRFDIWPGETDFRLRAVSLERDLVVISDATVGCREA